MSSAPRLLVDVREADNLRGFHALAALYLVIDRLRWVPLFRLGGDRADERIACEAFSFDTGVELRESPSAKDSGQHFDVYLSAADTLPWDEASVAARRAARRTVAALMFGLHEFQPNFGGRIVVGHDTAAIAAAVLAELGHTISVGGP